MMGWQWAVVVASAAALAVSAFYILLPKIVQTLLWLLLRLRYDFEITGLENLPRSGPVLVAANHGTWIDGFLLAAIVPRRGKALVNAGLVSAPVIKQLAQRAGIVPVPFKGTGAIRGAIEAARAALKRGECIGVFPEGQISRTGQMNPFLRGIELMVRGCDGAVIVPVAFDNLWGSIFSRSGGRFFTKWPRGLRRTVRIAFGPPLKTPVSAFAVRQAVRVALVQARALAKEPVPLPETYDLNWPHWQHPTLGLLTASAKDLIIPAQEVEQIANKPGTDGHPIPGVCLRVVDEKGVELPPGTPGRLEALLPDHAGWHETGRRGIMDSDGFVRLEPNSQTVP